METTSQNQPRSGVSLIGALAGMLVTFLGGIYVGLHPNWIPIKVSNGDSSSLTSGPAGPAAKEHPAVTPTSQPASAPAQ